MNLKPLAILTLAALILFDTSPHRAAAFTTFHSFEGKPLAWNLATLSGRAIRWQVDPAAPSIVHESALAVTQAWSDATGGNVNFVEGPGGITIVWDATGTLINDPLFLAFTSFLSAQNTYITNARTVINAAQYTWHRGGSDGVGPFLGGGKRDANLDAVLLHEIGHALGLDHSDKNPAGIVGAYSQSDLPTMNSMVFPGAGTLHSDDIAGVRFLYGLPQSDFSLTPIVVTATKISGRKPLNVNFTQSGGDENTAWDFGDGVTMTGLIAKHRFTALGQYTVRAECNGRSGNIVISVEKKNRRRKPAK